VIRASLPDDEPPTDSAEEFATDDSSGVPVSRFSAGRWTVIGMLLFGVTLVGALWIYWDQYTRPFRPLQQAIAQAYPTAQPYVVGGKAKSHLNLSPSTLRIVLQQSADDFDPLGDEAKSLNRAINLYHLAQQHQDLSKYEDLEVHLVQPVPEKPSRVFSLKLPLTEWKELKPLPEKNETRQTEADRS